MTTLTRMYLNAHKRQGRKLLSNPQVMHAAVRAAFPPDVDESATRVLWRVDQRQHEHVLYIVGPEEPDTGHLIEQAGWHTRPSQSLDYSRLLTSITLGQHWRFELVANPVKSLAGPRGTRGKVVPHVTPQQQLMWLQERSASAGFRLPGLQADAERGAVGSADVIRRDNLSFVKNESNARSSKVSLRTARFSGILEVTDRELLRRSLTQGIGRARAYGCGLLTMAKPEG